MTSTTNDNSNITARVVQAQLAAIASPLFDVGIFDPAGNDGDGLMILRTWTAQDISNNIDFLKYKNAHGHAIYIRPSGEHAYSLIDDLSQANVERLEPDHSPSVIVETSPNNFQVWLYHGELLPALLSSRVAAVLADQFQGDQGAAAWRQFGRLAGFTNNKAKYTLGNGLQPFVKLKHVKRVIYSNAPNLIAQVRTQLDQEQKSRSVRPNTPAAITSLKAITSFHADLRYGGDLHRADLAYAMYALSHGLTDEDVTAAIAKRDLSHKGSSNRQTEYIARTLRKAASALGLAVV